MVLDTLEIAGGSLAAGNHIITSRDTFDTVPGGTFTCGTGELVFDNTSGSYPYFVCLRQQHVLPVHL